MSESTKKTQEQAAEDLWKDVEEQIYENPQQLTRMLNSQLLNTVNLVEKLTLVVVQTCDDEALIKSLVEEALVNQQTRMAIMKNLDKTFEEQRKIGREETKKIAKAILEEVRQAKNKHMAS